MALAVARRGTAITIATEAEVARIDGTTKYAVILSIGRKVVHGTFDIGTNAPLSPYYTGYSTYDVTYKVGFFGLRARSIAVGLNRSYRLKRR